MKVTDVENLVREFYGKPVEKLISSLGKKADDWKT